MTIGRSVRRLAVVFTVAGLAAFAWITRIEAGKLVTNARSDRQVSETTPADRHLRFEDATVTTSDGLTLHGWFVPGEHRATITLVHGYKDRRSSVLGVAEILRRHGYGVLVASLRGHDTNDGELISFGLHEVRDLEAWIAYLRRRVDVNPRQLGMFGVSMGGTIAIGYAARDPGIRALVADCAFSSAADTIATSVRFFTGLPAFPFAPGIVFWMEREIGGRASDLDATRWIRGIAPRAVLLMQGGADRVVSSASGRKLFDAAGEPRELWFEPAVGHAEFLRTMPEEFERRVVAFFDRHLLD